MEEVGRACSVLHRGWRTQTLSIALRMGGEIWAVRWMSETSTGKDIGDVGFRHSNHSIWLGFEGPWRKKR